MVSLKEYYTSAYQSNHDFNRLARERYTKGWIINTVHIFDNGVIMVVWEKSNETS